MELKLNVHTVLKVILKFLEIICVVTAISLTTGHQFFIGDYRGSNFFCDGTLMLAIILTPILLCIDFLGNKDAFLFEAIVTVILGVFMIATGSLSAYVWNSSAEGPLKAQVLPKARGVAAMCILGGFFYLIDAVHSVVAFKSAS